MPSFQFSVQTGVRSGMRRPFEIEDLSVGADGTLRGRACVGISLEAIPDPTRKAASGDVGLSIVGSTDWRLGPWRGARGSVGRFLRELSRGHGEVVIERYPR